MRTLARPVIPILLITILIAGFIWLWISARRDGVTAPPSLLADNRQQPVGSGAHRSDTRESTPLLSDLTATRRSKTVLQDNPTQDGWDTEEFARTTGEQLAKLRRLIVEADRGQEAEISAFVTESFACDALRPKSRAEVFRDASLTVTRAGLTERTTSAEASPVRGAARLTAALREFKAPLANASEVRAQLKTIRVNKELDSTVTVVLVNTSGTKAGGSIQQNARWRCRWSASHSGKLPRLASIEVAAYEEAAVTKPSQTLLTDCTEAVLGSNRCFQDQILIGIPTWLDRMDANMAIGTFGRSGLAIGDVNGDGLDDVYVCQPAGLPNRLFLQQQNGTVVESAAECGVDWIDTSHSALLIDLDNDHDQDLAVSLGDELLLFSNDGSGHFTQRLALRLSSPGFSLAAADYDLDGRVDIYACVYFSQESNPGQLPDPLPYYDARNGGRNSLWRNEITANRAWKFHDVTNQVGLDQNNDRWTLAAAWEDFDNDGDMDLYVANDFGRNSLYRNDRQPDGSVSFRDIAAHAGVEDGSFGMSVTWADHDRDGWMDLYVSNMFSAAGNRITYQRQFKPDTDEATRRRYQYMARGNSLFRGTPRHTFEDVSVESGATMGRWAWASKFVDINNDGWEDLLVANGYLTNELQDDL